MVKVKFSAAILAVMLAGTGHAAMAQSDQTVTLRDAIAVAMQSNPEIIEVQMNKEAIQFEREQAQGLFAPRVELEASGGIRRLENSTRRALGIANNELYPLEAGIRASAAF